MVLYKDLNERWIDVITKWYGNVSYETEYANIYHILYKFVPSKCVVSFSTEKSDYYLAGELGDRRNTYFQSSVNAKYVHTILSDRKIGIYTDAYKFMDALKRESIGEPFIIRGSTKMFPLKDDIAVFVGLTSDVVTFGDNDEVYENEYQDLVNRITMFGPNEEALIDFFENTLKPLIIECTKKVENNEVPKYQLAYFDGRSIRTTFLSLKTNIGEVKDNYNDDLPYEKMNELLGSKKSELILFYGEPGTGKTSLIKHLIKDNKDKPFIFIDGSLFSSISDGTFLSFITDNKNAVLIFEDCEKILMKRDESYNQNIGTLLNLTDGLMADEYTLKFIMTFNCPMDKIDDALRRKGRLSLEYKFDKLKADKAHKINNSANEDITLADLYNLEEEVSIGAKKRVKIGFNK